jgi:hypothetical protein
MPKTKIDCGLTYRQEHRKDGTWQVISDASQFEAVQIQTALEMAAWEHAIWTKNAARLRELAQNLVDRWNNQQPEKWRYTLN